MCVTTVDFKGTLDQIIKSWEQWIMQMLQGLEDLEWQDMLQGLEVLD